MTTDNGTSASHPGHDSKGRFTRGNKGGPGNPHARRCAHLRQLLLDRISEDDLRAIAAKLAEKAKAGDLGAIRLVLSYTVGKPAASVDPDRLDVDEFELLQQQTRDLEEAIRPLNGIPAGVACDLMSVAVPALLDEQAQRALDTYCAAHPDFAPVVEAQRAQHQPRHSSPQQPSAPDTPPAVPSKGDCPTPRSVQEPAAAQSAAPSPALPSVAQILSFGPTVRSALAGARASDEPATDSKRPETAERAANPGQPASAAPAPKSEAGGS
jgi:hypothetical protein